MILTHRVVEDSVEDVPPISQCLQPRFPSLKVGEQVGVGIEVTRLARQNLWQTNTHRLEILHMCEK